MTDPLRLMAVFATFRYVLPDLRARIGDPVVEGYLFELLRACIVNFNTVASLAAAPTPGRTP